MTMPSLATMDGHPARPLLAWSDEWRELRWAGERSSAPRFPDRQVETQQAARDRREHRRGDGVEEIVDCAESYGDGHRRGGRDPRISPALAPAKTHEQEPGQGERHAEGDETD